MRLWEDKIDFIENMKNLSNDIYEEDNPFMDKKRVKVF